MDRAEEASDESLLAAYRRGDLVAFETLFRRYQAPLCRHLTRMLNDRATAEDLVIETFHRLHLHRDRFWEGALVRPWVYAIANNLARNRLRRERLGRWLPLAAVDAARPAVAVPPPSARLASQAATAANISRAGQLVRTPRPRTRHGPVPLATTPAAPTAASAAAARTSTGSTSCQSWRAKIVSAHPSQKHVSQPAASVVGAPQARRKSAPMPVKTRPITPQAQATSRVSRGNSTRAW